MPDKIFIGQRAKVVDRAPAIPGVTGVRMVTGDDTAVEAGTDASVWEISSPWASQEQAEWLLSKMAGYSYQPYTADTARLDPAAELGDYLTVGGVYSGLFSERNTFGTNFTADIAAPNRQDIDHEYPYQTASERQFTRMAKRMAAEFRIQADEISAKVSQVGGDNSTFGWSLKSDAMVWYANGTEVMRCSQDGLKVTGNINGGSLQIAGTLNVGGVDITAATLRSGASAGSSWANDYSYVSNTGQYMTGWGYSLTGGGYGFNFDTASKHTQTGPAYFYVSNSIGCGSYWFTPITIHPTDYPGAGVTVLGIINGQ